METRHSLGVRGSGVWLSAMEAQANHSYISGIIFINLLIFFSVVGSPSDAKWRQGSRSTLVQVMACCLTAPSHYLNQCWHIIIKVHDIHLRAISLEISQSPKLAWKLFFSDFIEISQGPMSQSTLNFFNIWVSCDMTRFCINVLLYLLNLPPLFPRIPLSYLY